MIVATDQASECTRKILILNVAYQRSLFKLQDTNTLGKLENSDRLSGSNKALALIYIEFMKLYPNKNANKKCV